MKILFTFVKALKGDKKHLFVHNIIYLKNVLLQKTIVLFV